MAPGEKPIAFRILYFSAGVITGAMPSSAERKGTCSPLMVYMVKRTCCDQTFKYADRQKKIMNNHFKRTNTQASDIYK